MKKYKHLDLVQRSQIFALKAKKIKQKDIVSNTKNHETVPLRR